MMRFKSIHTYSLLVIRLVAAWSTLPPPVVSASPLLHNATHTQVTPTTQTPWRPYNQDNATIMLNMSIIQDNEYLRNISQNFMRVLKDKIMNIYNGSNIILGGKNDVGAKYETGGKTETHILNSAALTLSQNDTRPSNESHSYNNEAYINETMYGDATEDDDSYYWNDTMADNTTGNFSDVFKVHSKIYRFQMIKVGVLCTVMSVIILSTCKMLLQVFAQYAGREKPEGEL